MVNLRKAKKKKKKKKKPLDGWDRACLASRKAWAFHGPLRGIVWDRSNKHGTWNMAPKGRLLSSTKLAKRAALPLP